MNPIQKQQVDFKLFDRPDVPTRSYQAGDVVLSEGDAAKEMFVVRSGKVAIKVHGRTVEEVTAGGMFGEMALIDDFPRSADARVHERCRLLVISKEALEDLLFLNRDLAYEILWNFVKILSARLRETNDKMTFLSVTGRF